MSVSQTRLAEPGTQPQPHWPSARAQAIFSFATPVEDDNKRYRALIERIRTQQKLTYQQLGEKIGLDKNRVWRLLSTDRALPVPERDAMMTALGIEHDRARLAVCYLQNIDSYDNVCGLNAASACAALFRQFDRHRDELRIPIKPSIIEEAISRTFKMLLQHQEQVIQREDHLA